MSQQEKGAYFRALKEAGVEFSKHYRDYSTAELQAAYASLAEARPDEFPFPLPMEQETAAAPVSRQPAPRADKNPDELPGQRLNSNAGLQPIRTDDQNRTWFQEEVLKPSYPRARGRRVLDYVETGTETKTVTTGDYTETFEVAGQGQGRAAQVKITLPSYQVGIYSTPQFPFKIHTYNENRGFDLFEVEAFYGGADLVPADVQRKYVANVLCYDIRTVVRAIETEHRQLQLMNRIP